MIAWHKADCANRMYVNLPGGNKATMPRYYKDKIYESWERKLASSTQLNKIREEDQKRIERGEVMTLAAYNSAVENAYAKMDLNYHQNQKL